MSKTDARLQITRVNRQIEVAEIKDHSETTPGDREAREPPAEGKLPIKNNPQLLVVNKAVRPTHNQKRSIKTT